MSKQVKSIAKGISVLSIAGIICKFIGVFFSVFLNRIDADIATAFYLVYPTYALLLEISSAGLPVAVSRMVAGFLAKNDPDNGKNVFRSALTILLTIGIIFSVLMVFMNQALTHMTNAVETSWGFYAIAPCVAIVCALSAFRGFFQGQQNMVPTAVSQLIEQFGKVLFSVFLAWYGYTVFNKDVTDHLMRIQYGAAGALLGITISELLALIYMGILYLSRKKEYNLIPQDAVQVPISSKVLMKKLVAISIPITISACIVPLSQFIDSAMMIDRMRNAGLTLDAAKSAYGVFTSVVIRLINIPTALALAISMSLVPVISFCRSSEDYEGIRRESNSGIRYAFLIGFPCSVGMSLLSGEIVHFLYGDVSSFTPDKLNLASELLSFSAITVVLFTVVQATSSILQGLRKQRLAMFTMIAGVAVKILLNYILIGTKGIDIHGGPYASIACYGLVMILNIVFVCKYSGLKFDLTNWVLRPGAASLLMGIFVWIMKMILPRGPVTTVVEVCIGILVFSLSAYLLKAITKNDLKSIRRRK